MNTSPTRFGMASVTVAAKPGYRILKRDSSYFQFVASRIRQIFHLDEPDTFTRDHKKITISLTHKDDPYHRRAVWGAKVLKTVLFVPYAATNQIRITDTTLLPITSRLQKLIRKLTPTRK